MALAAGRLLQFLGAGRPAHSPASSAGQIVGPIAVAPLLRHGVQYALIGGRWFVVAAGIAATLVRLPSPSPAGEGRRRRQPG